MQEIISRIKGVCQPIEGKSVLNAGCGDGKYCFPLIENGAASVIGIDSDESKIARAKKVANEKNVSDQCRFECIDVLKYESDEPFDFVIAEGLFDSVKDARHLLKKLRSLTGAKALLTFPRADTSLIRKIRLKVMGCPPYYYDEKRVKDHLLIAGFTTRNITIVGKYYFVEAT